MNAVILRNLHVASVSRRYTSDTPSHTPLASEHLHHHGCVTAYTVNHLPARRFLRKPLCPYLQPDTCDWL
jgi:hypothetical protein